MKYQHFVIVILLFSMVSCRQGQTVATSQSSEAKTVQKSEKLLRETQYRDFFDAEQSRLNGANKKAFDLYKKFIKAYPDNATAHYLLARLYFQKREPDNAEFHAKKSCSLDPSNHYFKEFYSQTLLYQNKTKDAELQYDELVKNDPENAEYIYKKAMLNIKSNRPEKAIEYLNQYEKLTGYSEEISLQKKNIYLKNNKYQEALGELRKLIEYNPHNVEYPIMMADIFDDQKQPDSVKKIYEGIEKKYKEEPLAQVALAQYYLNINDRKKYHFFMKEVMKNKNLNTDTKLALMLPSIKNMESDSTQELKDELLDMAKSVYQESPESKEAKLLYADVLYYTRSNKEAYQVYGEYIKLDSSNINAWIQLVSLAFEQQQYENCASYAEASGKYFPDNGVITFYHGLALVQSKKTTDGIAKLQKALTLANNEVNLKSQILSSLGDGYNTLKEYAKSDSSFKEALKLTPDDAGILNNYAYYLSQRKENLEEAEKMSKRSLVLQPNSKSFLDTYGWILYQQGKYQEAKTYIEKAILAGGEEDGTLYDHLGDVWYKLGNPEQAKKEWKKAKEKGEQNDNLLKKINTGTLEE